MIDTDGIAVRMDAYLQAMAAAGRFSGSVLVAHRGSVVHAAGYELADREQRVANAPHTRFRIGSITKQFTAMAALILEERGKLDVRAPLATYLPDCPERWKAITPHHLLQHTSGIPNLTNFPGVFETTARLPLSVREVIDTFRDKPLEFVPGTNHRYSNSGYILLGDLIERVSGQTYERFLRDAIFEPLEMADSGYDRFEAILPHRARGYVRRDGEWFGCAYLDMGYPYAAGALYSTVEDLHRWDRALLAGRLVGSAAHARMNTIAPLLAPYGYGVGLGRELNRRTISHSGGINGFRSNLLRFPDEPACVIALGNSEPSDAVGVTRALAALLFGESVEPPTVRRPVEIDEATLAALAGVYEIVPGVTLQIEAGRGRLRVVSGAAQSRFAPESETQFFREDSGDTLTFNGPQLILKQGDVEIEARKVSS